jgi:hypothetical protein
MQRLDELPPEFASFPLETALLNEWRAVEQEQQSQIHNNTQQPTCTKAS